MNTPPLLQIFFSPLSSPARIICFMTGMPNPSFKLNVYCKIQGVFLAPEARKEGQQGLTCNKTQRVRKALENPRSTHDCQGQDSELSKNRASTSPKQRP